MIFSRVLLGLIAQPLKWGRHHRPQVNPAQPRILVIRRNRLGDMIYTLPLLHALRRHYQTAHITVACDPTGAPIAQACPAVNEVIILDGGWTRLFATMKNASRLQNFDWVIAAKGGVDRRLATLTRLTNAAIRIGFDRHADLPSTFYTEPVALPENPHEEHQIDTLLRLLKPLGLVKPTEFTVDLTLRVPDSSQKLALEILARPPFAPKRRYLLINLSSTVRLKFRDEDFVALATKILTASDLTIGLVAAPADQSKARVLAQRINSDRVTAVTTPGPLDLAALLQTARFLITPEGGAAHIAASMNTPALVIWSEGPFKKWHSRAANHSFVHAVRREKLIPVDRVWEALQPFLVPKK